MPAPYTTFSLAPTALWMGTVCGYDTALANKLSRKDPDRAVGTCKCDVGSKNLKNQAYALNVWLRHETVYVIVCERETHLQRKFDPRRQRY